MERTKAKTGKIWILATFGIFHNVKKTEQALKNLNTRNNFGKM